MAIDLMLTFEGTDTLKGEHNLAIAVVVLCETELK